MSPPVREVIVNARCSHESQSVSLTQDPEVDPLSVPLESEQAFLVSIEPPSLLQRSIQAIKRRFRKRSDPKANTYNLRSKPLPKEAENIPRVLDVQKRKRSRTSQPAGETVRESFSDSQSSRSDCSSVGHFHKAPRATCYSSSTPIGDQQAASSRQGEGVSSSFQTPSVGNSIFTEGSSSSEHRRIDRPNREAVEFSESASRDISVADNRTSNLEAIKRNRATDRTYSQQSNSAQPSDRDHETGASDLGSASAVPVNNKFYFTIVGEGDHTAPESFNISGRGNIRPPRTQYDVEEQTSSFAGPTAPPSGSITRVVPEERQLSGVQRIFEQDRNNPRDFPRDSDRTVDALNSCVCRNNTTRLDHERASSLHPSDRVPATPSGEIESRNFRPPYIDNSNYRITESIHLSAEQQALASGALPAAFSSRKSTPLPPVTVQPRPAVATKQQPSVTVQQQPSYSNAQSQSYNAVQPHFLPVNERGFVSSASSTTSDIREERFAPYVEDSEMLLGTCNSRDTEHERTGGERRVGCLRCHQPRCVCEDNEARMLLELERKKQEKRATMMLTQLRSFSGTELDRFDDWIREFETIASVGRWSDADKSSMLLCKLTNAALDVYYDLKETYDANAITYKLLKERLQQRFHAGEDKNFYQQKLEKCSRRPGEEIRQYAHRLVKYFNKAYPIDPDNHNAATRFEFLRSSFLKGLSHELRVKLRMKDIGDFETLVSKAEKYAPLYDEKERKDDREYIDAVRTKRSLPERDVLGNFDSSICAVNSHLNLPSATNNPLSTEERLNDICRAVSQLTKQISDLSFQQSLQQTTAQNALRYAPQPIPAQQPIPTMVDDFSQPAYVHQRNNRFPPKRCTYCQKGGHLAEECYSRIANERRSKTVCYNCGKPGHYSANCRSKAVHFDNPPQQTAGPSSSQQGNL